MKIILSFIILLPLLFFFNNNSFAQAQTLPEIKFPEIEYKPSFKKGWVGQYVYELHFFDSLYYKNGKYEKRLWLRADNTHTGYIEFPTEAKGAIRSNQPDKNNPARYESWIGSGTRYSWSVVNDTLKRTDPIGVMGSISVIGKTERTQVYYSKGEWIKGWMNNADMQIDHTEKKYSLAIPVVTFDTMEMNGGRKFILILPQKYPSAEMKKAQKITSVFLQ